jgi:nucleoside-diphosphate-sugar epimerase
MASTNDIILVTGSSGFIGSKLVERLAEQAEVVGLDVKEPAQLPENSSFVELDLASDEGVAQALDQVREMHGERIASVVHLAAYFDLSGESDPLYDEVTVRGTERLLRGLQKFEVEQFIYSSTMLVHAPGKPGERITEERPLMRKFPYRNSKIETEALVRERRGSFPIVLFRPAGVYDDMCHSAFLAHQIARTYERSPKSHVYPGDLTTAQSFIHVEDLVDALVRLIERRRELPEELELLVGEPEAIPYEALQRQIGRLLHDEDWQVWQVPKALAKSGAWLQDKAMGEDSFVKPWMVDAADDDYTLDPSRAKELLDWQPQHTLHKSLPKMIQALKDDPEGWYVANDLDPGRLDLPKDRL